MQVNVYPLRPSQAAAGLPPRAWRISTPDGVFWLLEGEEQGRLLVLPLSFDAVDEGVARSDDLLARGVALALAAETEAAGRWVRRGSAVGPPASPLPDTPA